MKPDDIREAVGVFLQLIESGAETGPDEETRLALLLDRLALAQHFVAFEFDDTEYPDPPGRNYQALRELVARRFPRYGFYNVPEFVTSHIGEGRCHLGDAIDDLADITSELLEVEWRWENTSEADALWHLDFSYRSHWREHLRGLQLYLWGLDQGR